MRCGRCTRSLLSIAHGNRLSAPVPPVDSRDERSAARSPLTRSIMRRSRGHHVLPDGRFQAAIDLAAAGFGYA